MAYKFSNYCHFTPLRHPYFFMYVEKYGDDLWLGVKVFMIRLHGPPKSIVSDRLRVFVSQFWKDLHKFQGTELHMSSSNHQLIDRQTEVVNKGLAY